jgi:hypothetical protein
MEDYLDGDWAANNYQHIRTRTLEDFHMLDESEQQRIDQELDEALAERRSKRQVRESDS